MLAEQIKLAFSKGGGAAIDLNFIPELSANRVCSIIEVLRQKLTLVKAEDSDGCVVTDITACLDRPRGTVFTTWTHGAVIEQLQFYVSWKDPQKIFAEITFFPEDIDWNKYSADDFLEFVAEIVAASGEPDFYLRYENANWRYGDIGPESWVILSHKSVR
ncbi:hypothetical protein JCM19000A_42880 [Silvimonas sp. JCM 19000]